MNDSSLFRDEPAKYEARPPLGEELLPPVEQPSARFIVQLFVVPALIVVLIVGVWLSFNWLVRSTALGPEKLIQGIEEGPSVARWQRASELADLLQNKRYAHFKREPEAANHLARMLDRELERSKAGDNGQEQATFRYFLAMALGQFEVPAGLDTLLKAAETKADVNEELVRDAALKAIAVRAYNLHQLAPPQELVHPDLEPTLMRLTSDDNARIRWQVAYALGQIASPAALEHLQLMLDDSSAHTRYNAAVALARHGNAKAVETLAEMLDLDELAAVRDEESEGDQRFERTLLISSAIGAARSLAQQNPNADLSPVIKALERMSKADPATLQKAHIEPRISAEADLALKALKSPKK